VVLQAGESKPKIPLGFGYTCSGAGGYVSRTRFLGLKTVEMRLDPEEYRQEFYWTTA
jgi:hypothetical protein